MGEEEARRTKQKEEEKARREQEEEARREQEEKARRKQKEEEEEARTVWMSGKQAPAAPALAANGGKAPTAPRAPTPDPTSSPMRRKSADAAERLAKAKEYHAKNNTKQIFYDKIPNLGSGSDAIKHYHRDYHGPKYARNEEGGWDIICTMCLTYGDQNRVESWTELCTK